MAKENTADEIFKLLDSAGLPKVYVRSLMPHWWNDQAAENPAGLSEFKLALSRNLGVDVAGLSAEKPQLEFRLPHVRKLKRSVRYSEVQLTPAVSIGLSAARVAVAACPKGYVPLPPASELRQQLFERFDINYVSLRALIRVCWDHGIPVVYAARFPDGMPRMDGMVATINGRPAIVLSKKTPFSAWMGFVLAHEMGHLANGHCNDGEMIVDESLNELSVKDDEADPQEKEADTYALEMLSGLNDFLAKFPDDLDPKQLAEVAMTEQRKHQIDAGHLILTHAYKSGDWQRSIAALKVLDTEARAATDVLEAMTHEIDPARVSDSSLAFLFRVCRLIEK